MEELEKSIIEKLKKENVDESTLSLFQEIFGWYRKGGMDYAIEQLKNKIKETGEVKEEIKTIKEILPKRKKRRRKNE